MEGIIKFKANWKNTDSISKDEYAFINPWRKLCFDKSIIGVGDDGIGYGNISFRIGKTNQFVISGSATGHIPNLESKHYSKVVDFDIVNNSIDCRGRTIASSESMSHAAIYAANSNIKCVIHLHHKKLWEDNKNQLPTTDTSIEYGTVAMAEAIFNMVKNININQIIMGGHENGIILFDNSFELIFKNKILKDI